MDSLVDTPLLLAHRGVMTSRTWFGGGDEIRRIAVGAAVSNGVATWGAGYVEAFVNVRGLWPVVESARAYPLNGFARDVTRDLQAELTGT